MRKSGTGPWVWSFWPNHLSFLLQSEADGGSVTWVSKVSERGGGAGVGWWRVRAAAGRVGHFSPSSPSSLDDLKFLWGFKPLSELLLWWCHQEAGLRERRRVLRSADTLTVHNFCLFKEEEEAEEEEEQLNCVIRHLAPCPAHSSLSANQLSEDPHRH